MRRVPRRPSRAVLSVAIGVALVAIAVAGGWLYWQDESMPSGAVTLTGVFVNFTYAPGSPRPYGLSNETCLECPLTFKGGTHPWVLVVSLPVRAGWDLSYNDTIHSGVPFYAQGWAGSGPTPVIYQYRFLNVSIPGPNPAWGDQIELVVPFHAPIPSERFVITATLSVNLVKSG